MLDVGKRPYLRPLRCHTEIKSKGLAPCFPGWIFADDLQRSTAPRVRKRFGRCTTANAQPFCIGQMYLQDKFNECLCQRAPLRCNNTCFQLREDTFVLCKRWLTHRWCSSFFKHLGSVTLKIIRGKNSAKTRSSPLDFIFDTCASASSSHLF